MSTVAQVIKATGLSSAFCADLLGVSRQQFESWLAPQASLPRYAVPILSAVVGADLDVLQRSPETTDAVRALPPAIWYKLSDSSLTATDRELVGIIRKLAFHNQQLRTLRKKTALGFRAVFREVRNNVDLSASPDSQGILAAEWFRSSAQLQHGNAGIGDLLRPALRRLGLLVLESPVRNSRVEGCCFTTTIEQGPVPCIFANTYRSTWFRRNAILAHELCHAIFDVENDQVSIDFKGGGTEEFKGIEEFKERRARVFMQNILAPREVLVSAKNRFGINWRSLNQMQMAKLVADLGVEQKVIGDAAFDAGWIDASERDAMAGLNCESELKSISSHALSTEEFLAQGQISNPLWAAKHRTASVGSATLRFPVGYVDEVVQAAHENLIAPAKAAELLMTDKRSLQGRFGIKVFGE